MSVQIRSTDEGRPAEEINLVEEIASPEQQILLPLDSCHILGMRVDASSYSASSDRILAWAESREPGYVCVASVNNVMEAHDDPGFREIMNQADMVTSDGMPLVWGLRRLGFPMATQVRGTDLTELLCARAAEEGIPVGFYGGAPDVLEDLTVELQRRFPALSIVYKFSPPYRELTPEEDAQVVQAITASRPGLLFIGLSTPKQERFMVSHRDNLGTVMVGVGAAFDFLAGRKK